MFNHMAKVARIFKQLHKIEGFHIRAFHGNFKTQKQSVGYNYYKYKYVIYINDERIKYAVFYQKEKLAVMLKISLSELDKYIKHQ